MEENNSIDFKNALETLEKASETFSFEVYIPSLKSNLKFRQIDAKQQKDILGSAVDTTVYNTNFIEVFYNILKQNFLSEDKSVIDNLTMVDKASIALGFRKQISDEINVTVSSEPLVQIKRPVDPIINNFKDYISEEPLKFEAETSQFKLEVELKPVTVYGEYAYDNEFNKNIKKENIKTTDDVQKLVSEAFIGETTKYINKIWINGSEVLLNNLSFTQRVALVERLPSNLIQKIVQTISEWKAKLDDILTVEYGDKKVPVQIDSLLFLG